MTSRHHDLLIIGTGSGNSLVTPELAHLDIAIAEKGRFGGTCLNVGCIPTKMYVYPADVIEAAAHLDRLGARFDDPQTRWREVRDRVFGRIDAIADGGEAYRRGDEHITVYGEVRFTGEREVTTDDGVVVTADRVVVAAGARPVMLDVPGLDAADPARGIHTSDTIMRMDAVPARTAVIGGGFIAAEMAHVLDAFGTRVTWLQRSDRLLRADDETISRIFTDVQTQRFDLRLDTQVTAAERVGEEWHLTLSDGSDLVVDAVLVAVGRRPNTDLLDVAAAGLATHDDGRLVVDEYQRTSVEGVWALGDICSPHMLKHVANHEARVVAHNLAHPDDLVAADHRFVPSATFGYPQVASFGPTERELRETGRDIVVKEQKFGDTAYGWAMEDEIGLCKVVADPATKQVLAAHIVGYQASLLIQPLVQAASLGTPVPDVARGQYWIHPALMEVVENALLGLDL